MVACICRPSTHRQIGRPTCQNSLRRQRRKEENKVKPIWKLRKISTSQNMHNFLNFFRTTMKQPLLESKLIAWSFRIFYRSFEFEPDWYI